MELAQIEPGITFNPIKLKDAEVISDTATNVANSSPLSDFNPSPQGGGDLGPSTFSKDRGDD